MSDVEQINGVNVGFSYLRFYRAYPEIGLPIAEQRGDVGGHQEFQHATLSWDGEKVTADWTDNDTPLPDWMNGETSKSFEV